MKALEGRLYAYEGIDFYVYMPFRLDNGKLSILGFGSNGKVEEIAAHYLTKAGHFSKPTAKNWKLLDDVSIAPYIVKATVGK